MRRRRRHRIFLLLPPVLLAAIFLWLMAGQLKHGQQARPDEIALQELLAADEPPEPGAGFHIRTDGKADSMPGAGAEVLPENDEVSLLFAGDIYLSSHVLNAYDKAGGIAGILGERLRTEIADADFFVANQEFSYSDRGTQMADKEFTFRLPSSRVHILQEIGTDLVTLANNHILDFGREAMLDNCMLLDQAGILRIGAGADLEEAKRPETVEIKGRRIGFLGASRVIPEGGWTAGASRPGVLATYDPAILIKEIEELRKRCDYLVVYVHWGIERETKPQEYQRTMAKQYIDAGADLVVGSHPHVLQGIEYYKGKPILYSLGNFVFGSVIPETMLVKVGLSPDGKTTLKLVPAVSSAGYTRGMEDAKHAEFFQRIQALSDGVTVDAEGNVFPAE